MATDLLFDDLVAIKQLPVDLDADDKALRTFQTEAAAGARLGRDHSNIVPVRDYGVSLTSPYFVMDWIEGRNLQDLCGRLGLRSAMSYFRQVLSALKFAHARGIVHSDVAPANIILRADSHHVYLADFGYLKVVDSMLVSAGSKSLLQGGRPYFMPPEHWWDPSRINYSTDVYSLAVTLHMLLTGARLKVDATGHPLLPGVVVVRHEQVQAPDVIRRLLVRFISERRESDQITDLEAFLSGLE